MSSDFSRIWPLLRAELESRPVARDEGGPPDEVCELISLFADGKLSAEHRDRLIAAMTERPDWVEHLAAEIKSRRGIHRGTEE